MKSLYVVFLSLSILYVCGGYPDFGVNALDFISVGKTDLERLIMIINESVTSQSRIPDRQVDTLLIY